MTKNRIRCTMALAVCMLVVGCGDYRDASPRTYQYATSLYAICNREDAAKLDEVAQQIATDRDTGDLSARQADWLDAIVASARAGEWKPAMHEARKIMQQ
jgi:hypothetical protein